MVWAEGRVGSAGCGPAVGAGIVSPAGVQIAAAISAPHDHFTAGPDCRVKLSAVGRADNARWSPCVIGAGRRLLRAVSAAGVQIAGAAKSTPYDHLAPGPYCRVEFSASGCAGAASGCPTIGAGIISPAGVQKAAVVSSPHEHFISGPDCRVIFTGRSR